MRDVQRNSTGGCDNGHCVTSLLSCMNPGEIAGAVVLAILILTAAVYARRAGLYAAALERQMMELRGQYAAFHEEDRRRAQAASEHLQQELDRRMQEAAREAGGSAAQLREALGAQMNAFQERLAAVTGRMQLIADAVEAAARKPLEGFPIDAARLETKTEEEIIALAQSMAILRPLVPYPKWRFDADWANPDLAFQLRQRLWQYFRDRQREGAVVVGWHAGTRLRLYLGNDVSRQIFIAGCIDPNEFALLDRLLRPGMTFVDAGANEGVYAVFAAQRVGAEGTVWAFEPSRRELDRLGRNLALNELAVRVFPLALGDRSTQAELIVAGYGHEGHNTLGAFAHDCAEVARKEIVELARLDDLVNREQPARIDVMKLDVEGAELRSLQGGVETLRRYRPVLLFEVGDAALRHQGSSQEELLDYLRARDYTLHMFDPYSGLPTPAVPGVYSDNMIAVPAGMSLPEAVYRPWPA